MYATNVLFIAALLKTYKQSLDACMLNWAVEGLGNIGI
jgi:hypothetical protein